MTPQLRLCFFILLVMIGARPAESSAQTCSVNAGVPSSICVTSDSFMLMGNATGLLSTTATWSLVSGPNIPVITSPASTTTSVKGITAGTYIFSYSATCSDASVVADSVTITVNALPVFTAGNDTAVCGSGVNLNATLPAGATGLWSYVLPAAPNGLLSLTIGTPGSRTSNVSLGSYNPTCPKTADMIWTVTQGACTGRDTVRVALAGQSSSFSRIADATVCGTTFAGFYYYGCGGNMVVTQLSGPAAATIGYAYGVPATVGYNQFNISNMIVGAYNFKLELSTCSGTIFRDTFQVTVGSTVTLSNPGVPGLYKCPDQFDSVYYFTPGGTLLPGETFRWNLTPTGKSPVSLANPVADTIGRTLRLRNVQHPDSSALQDQYQYFYSYTVSNGTCSQTTSVPLSLYTPLPNRPFMPVLNLVCGVTATNIAQPVTGTGVSYNFRNIVVISKPSGAPNPVYSSVSTAAINVTGLVPGKYIFSFEYSRGNAGCGVKSAVVEVNAGAIAGLSNAGTNQILACGVDSSVLAGNTPPAGQTGTWQLVSGPSSVVLTNPNAPSLLIKNLLPGYYTFRWAINSGTTCAATSDEMIVVVTPTAPVANAGADRSTCYGYAIPLSGNPVSPVGLGTTGRWRQIAGPVVSIADSTKPNTSVSGTTAGNSYSFTWTLSNVCGAGTDTVVITTGASQGPSSAVITTADTCLTAATTLTLRAIAAVTGTGSWSQLSGPGTATIATPAANTTTVSGLIAGEYKFIWMVQAAGCDSLRDTVSVAYRSSALVANAGADRYICGDTFNLAATSPLPGIGTWTQIGGPATVISSPNTIGSNVSGLAGGSTYDYRWTVSLGACGASSDDVHVGTSVPPSAAIAMPDTIICGRTLAAGTALSFPISANTPAQGVGTWTILDVPYYYGATGITNVASPNTTVTLVGGTTVLQWQVSNGACPATKDTVTIQLVPKADAGPASYSLCELSSQDLAGTSPANGTSLWTQISGPSTATITQPSNPFTQVTNMITGIYKFRYDITHPVSGCSSFDTITISNSIRPVANAGRDSSFCWQGGSTTLLLKADTPSLGSGAWTRTLGSGTVSFSPGAGSNPANATVSAPGLHQFRWTVTNGGCQAIDYKDVLVEQLTVPAINFTPATACRDSFTVNVASPYSNFNYAWSFSRARIRDTSGLNLSGPIANNFIVSDTNTIYLRITNPVTGCTARDSTAIIVNCSYLPLPLHLLSFDAKRKDSRVQLSWLTTNERDIRLYHIERSADGRQWSRIGRANATNSLSKESAYEFTDRQPANGANLYRLYIEELDQTFSYSPVKMVMMDDAAAGMLLYPNPANNTVHIVLQNESVINTYELTDAMGKLIRKADLKPAADNAVDISNLVPGMYILKVMMDQSVISKQLQVIR